MSQTPLPPKTPTLTVYKASAGSGKTFRLAIEYIKFLLEDSKAYEGILAVTFTNKATEEMKMRILSTLYGLWKQLPDSSSYMKELQKETGMSDTAISQRSERALRLLLHNYQYFKVQTIDTFFQGVLRNLARELQLSANLRVGLNTKEVVEEAVDEIIDSIADDKELRRVVMSYIEDSLSDNKQWNIIGDIKNFGGTIFTELYKQHRRDMERIYEDKDFFDRYKSELIELRKKSQEKYISLSKEVLQKMQEAGLSLDDFAKKASGPMSYFLKLSKGDFAIGEDKLLNKTVVEAMDNASKWYTKTSKRTDDIQAFYDKTLKPFFNIEEPNRRRDAREYNSATEVLHHINDVRLLKQIEDTARELNDTSQRFMLSDTQSLLHEIISDDDSPFIFEKIGTHLKHVMIDEFQDTSKVQWANFKVLLRECMSQGFRNLVVGDVKQSIYRFRNGDWRLLNDIDRDSDFPLEALDFNTLKTNYRSSRNVIAFNNSFLGLVAQIEVNDVSRFSQDQAESIRKAYADVAQEIPPVAKNHGLVCLEMLPQSQKDTMAEHTLNTILDLIGKGIPQNDIAILMRKAVDIPAMADYIEKESSNLGTPVKIVSSEAFRLDSSACVRIIVNAMKVLAHPDDKMSLALLVNDFHTTIHSAENLPNSIFSKEGNLTQWLPETFSTQMESISTMSLADMAESLMRLFSINQYNSEGAYVTTFFDCLHQHCSDFMPTLDDFLARWESDYCKKTIETSDIDGIRILTIHKSKGLEFKNVIIPYCNWSGNPPGSVTLWTTPSQKPFSKLPLVPVRYSSEGSLKDTIFEEDSHQEYIQNAVDNLNLLYVAMTRAEDSLFIIGERDATRYNRSKALCAAIKMLPKTVNNGMTDEAVNIDNMDDSEKPLIVTYGHLHGNETEESPSEKEESRNVFTPAIEPTDINVESFPMQAEFRQSNESRRFADDALDEKDNNRWIRLGTIMHQVFSTIRTLDDVEPVLRSMEFDGALYDKDLTHEEVILSLRQKFDNPQVKGWFSNEWQVFNECTILTTDGEQRPDRVITNGTETIVIDFKFGRQKPEYHNQVRGYMTLLSQLGMPSVHGFLWYVSLNKILPVK